MPFLTGEGETAWLRTKIRSCPFLGLLGTRSATHAMDEEEGEMLKPLAVVGQARDEGEKECSCSKMFFNACHLSVLLFHFFKKLQKLAWRLSQWGTWAVHLFSVCVLELLGRDGKAAQCSKYLWSALLIQSSQFQSISRCWWIFQDTRKEEPAVVLRGSVWDPVMWSTGMVQLPLSSLSGEMAGDEGLVPCKNLAALSWGTLGVTLHVFLQCDLAVEEICFPVGVIRLISMQYEQLHDIISLSFDVTARNGVMKPLCSGSYGSTHQVILRDSPNVPAVAITCGSTQLPSKAVALDIKPQLKE